MSVTQCELRSQKYALCNPLDIGITRKMTPEEFDQACAAIHPAFPLDAAKQNGFFTLTMAASAGNVRLVHHIVSKGSTLQHVGANYGQTPLYCAVLHNQPSVVKTLILLGSDVNMCNQYGRTPLTQAAKGGWSGMVKLLILYGGVESADAAELEQITQEELKNCKQIIEQAKKTVKVMQKTLFTTIFHCTRTEPTIPNTLVDIIACYVPLDEIPDNFQEFFT